MPRITLQKDRRKTDKVISQDTSWRSWTKGVFWESFSTDVTNDIVVQFSYGISLQDIKSPTEKNNGTVWLKDGNELYVQANSTADWEAFAESIDNVRYRPGHTGVFLFTAGFENGELEGWQTFVWPHDSDNGFRLGYNDSGDLVIQILKNGSVVHETKKDSWNGMRQGFIDDIDFSKLQVFRLFYGYLGIAPISLEVIYPQTDEFYPLHTFRLQWTQTETHTDLPYLPIKAQAKNTSGTPAKAVFSGSWRGGIMGETDRGGNKVFSSTGQKTIGDTDTETGFYALRSKDKISNSYVTDKINKILTKIVYTDFSSEIEGIARISFIENPTISGGTWNDVDSDESVIEENTGFTGFSWGTKKISFFIAGASGSPASSSNTNKDVNFSDLWVDLKPWDTFAITAERLSGSTSYSIYYALNWFELF